MLAKDKSSILIINLIDKIEYFKNTEEIKKFAKKRDWEKFHSLKNLSISLSLEASELMEIFQWENENSKFHEDKKKKKKVSEEVADVMLYLLRFSDIAKIDLEKECLKKIIINARKYPIKLSKGKSTKYNKLKRS